MGGRQYTSARLCSPGTREGVWMVVFRPGLVSGTRAGSPRRSLPALGRTDPPLDLLGRAQARPNSEEESTK